MAQKERVAKEAAAAAARQAEAETAEAEAVGAQIGQGKLPLKAEEWEALCTAGGVGALEIS